MKDGQRHGIHVIPLKQLLSLLLDSTKNGPNLTSPSSHPCLWGLQRYIARLIPVNPRGFFAPDSCGWGWPITLDATPQYEVEKPKNLRLRFKSCYPKKPIYIYIILYNERRMKNSRDFLRNNGGLIVNFSIVWRFFWMLPCWGYPKSAMIETFLSTPKTSSSCWGVNRAHSPGFPWFENPWIHQDVTARNSITSK